MIVAAVALTLVATVRSSGSTMKVGRTFSSPIVSVVGVAVVIVAADAASGSTLRSRTGGSLLQILKLRGKIHVECGLLHFGSLSGVTRRLELYCLCLHFVPRERYLLTEHKTLEFQESPHIFMLLPYHLPAVLEFLSVQIISRNLSHQVHARGVYGRMLVSLRTAKVL